MILNRFILPGTRFLDRTALYYHGGGHIRADGGVDLPPGQTVTFDTYFNAFFYGAYVRYTEMKTVTVRLSVSGTAVITLMAAGQGDSVRELDCRQVNQERQDASFQRIPLSELPANGMLYIKAEAKERGAVIHSGSFETEDVEISPVKLAAVICTYRREEYVLRNLQTIRQEIWEREDSDVRDALDVLVIDNGQTLNFPDEEHIQLLKNKNTGGSGGFTRGMIEACDAGIYTHILLMDDDISFEPETIARTIRFLRIARQTERPLCIGGQMLIQDQPTVQHESGAFYRNGIIEPRHFELDLSGRRGLLRNESADKRRIDYNGWWYCCFSLETIRNYGLPFPFFIKQDDIEYSLRVQPETVAVNGIGVWHEAFEKKDTPYTEYYYRRNGLITSAVHNNGSVMLRNLLRLLYTCGKAALLGNPQHIHFVLWGYRDFLKGPDFLLETDEESLNSELLQVHRQRPKTRLQSIFTDPFRMIPVLVLFTARYATVRREYIRRKDELTSMEFWRRHLGIEPGYEAASDSGCH